MARQKTDWNLNEAGSKGLVSTKSREVSIRVKDKDTGEKTELKGNITVVGRVANLPGFIAHVEAVINKGKPDEKKVHLTHEYLLREFVNNNIVTNFKQYLRVKANPKAAVAAAIKRLRDQFPKLSEDKLKAMAEMMIDSMTAE